MLVMIAMYPQCGTGDDAEADDDSTHDGDADTEGIDGDSDDCSLRETDHDFEVMGRKKKDRSKSIVYFQPVSNL